MRASTKENPDMNNLMAKLMKASAKPRLFEPGEPKFWDDPHISKGMLEAHLNPNHDAASRMPGKIDSTVRHLLDSGVLKPGMRYWTRILAPYAKGCTRPEFMLLGSIYHSVPSIMQEACCTIRDGYRGCYVNFFDMDYTGEFDVAIQIYGGS